MSNNLVAGASIRSTGFFAKHQNKFLLALILLILLTYLIMFNALMKGKEIINDKPSIRVQVENPSTDNKPQPVAQTIVNTVMVSKPNEYEYWNRNYYIKTDPHRAACSDDIGIGLVQRWRNAEQLICRPHQVDPNSEALPSEVFMYRVKQTRHVAEDNFVRITNLATTLDSFASSGLEKGWYANCDRISSQWTDQQGLFQLHLQNWMRQFKGQKIPKCDARVKRRVVFMQRDGEYNLFHSMSDFVMLFINYMMILFKGTVTNTDASLINDFVKNTDIVLLDGYQKGYYIDILKAMAANVFTYSEYQKYLAAQFDGLKSGGVVCISEVLMATPGGSCFLFKDAW